MRVRVCLNPGLGEHNGTKDAPLIEMRDGFFLAMSCKVLIPLSRYIIWTKNVGYG
jgi:hypothetical protein